MKKLILIAAVFLMTGLAFGQTLQKGNVLGIHNGTFLPNADVTFNQCMSFVKDKYFPAVEKNFPGTKLYLLKGIRGECVDCFAYIEVFQSDEVRNKYWSAEGVLTELGTAAMEKLKPLAEEMTKYGKLIDKYTDWVVQ